MRLVLRPCRAGDGCGLVVGAGAVLGLGRFVNTLLFGLVATDLTMVLVAGATLAAAAALAGYLSRASRGPRRSDAGPSAGLVVGLVRGRFIQRRQVHFLRVVGKVNSRCRQVSCRDTLVARGC